MSRLISRRSVLALASAVVFMTSACGSGAATDTQGGPASPQGMSTATGPDMLDTVAKGKLTIATGQPAFSPWVENDDPASGQGFEAAVAYAVADELGFAKEDVTWTRTSFDAAIAPGAKNWDMNIQQFSITDERKKAVDFSSSYYRTSQAVLTTVDTPAASAKSLADLKDIQFGVQTSTSSQQILNDVIKPSKNPMVFNNSVDVVQALKNKQIQAIVVDLPTALYLASAELDQGKIVGQLTDAAGDEFAFVLPKGSQLTAPVSKAVDKLRDDGTLAQLQQKWLSDSVKVPELK